jgi:hypothetical protein
MPCSSLPPIDDLGQTSEQAASDSQTLFPQTTIGKHQKLLNSGELDQFASLLGVFQPRRLRTGSDYNDQWGLLAKALSRTNRPQRRSAKNYVSLASEPLSTCIP